MASGHSRWLFASMNISESAATSALNSSRTAGGSLGFVNSGNEIVKSVPRNSTCSASKVTSATLSVVSWAEATPATASNTGTVTQRSMRTSTVERASARPDV
jgi:hypothetical protein